jgi:hypothetical protein
MALIASSASNSGWGADWTIDDPKANDRFF